MNYDETHDFLDQLAETQKLVDESYYSYALSQPIDVQKRQVRKIIGKLNDGILDQITACKDPSLKKRATALSSKLLTLFDKITSNDQGLLTFDQKIIWMASKLNKEFYPPYDDSIDVFVGNTCNSLDEGLRKLSTDENKWSLRPNNINDKEGIMDLFQSSLSNCSFVSSILSIANLNVDLIHDIVKTQQDSITLNKQFAILLRFNGTKRIVYMDSYLPADDTLFVKSSSNSNLLFPAFIEKAYLKINGVTNFDCFKGSNFAIDTFILTGFIPESISVDELTQENLLNVYKLFKEKKIVLGLGTADLTKDECEHYKLVPFHDYSIIDIKLANSNSQSDLKFSVMNPWIDKENSKRVFEVDYLYHFNALYIGWNPNGMFDYQYKRSFFSTQKSEFTNKSFIDNVQYTVSNNSKEENEVWVLVERHFHPVYDDSSSSRSISMKAEWFDADNTEKLWGKSLQRVLLKTLKSESKFLLSKLKLKPFQKATGVFFLDDEDTSVKVTPPVFFTVHAYAKNLVDICKSSSTSKDIKTVSDIWSPMQSGGSWSHGRYFDNPQFELIINDDSSNVNAMIGLFTNDKMMVNFLVFESSSKFRFLTDFDERSLVRGQDLKYSSGHQVKKVGLESGKRYIIVASTYSFDEYDTFKLRVKCSTEFQLTKISNSLGLYTKTIPFTFQPKELSFSANFELSRNSKIIIKINTESKLQLNAKLVDLETKRVIDQSSGFKNYMYGLFLGGDEVKSGKYQVIVERMEGTCQSVCDIQIGTSVAVL
ncbi:hypothetical protein CANARDRAFT_28716 [[Candida] arabinofermentans NRRL YB-2248]|uniref:Cysteine protease RIM13 n=1 Tax=[Candida] arabinofermentans NRRL YB-2248 TaxID=983967 RepID=A0A1E4SZS1_9ASCO|nr:hypothetical protein CANARDRAFT_28716 [[Candida] arabinofermentans NRRL YB-2248]